MIGIYETFDTCNLVRGARDMYNSYYCSNTNRISWNRDLKVLICNQAYFVLSRLKQLNAFVFITDEHLKSLAAKCEVGTTCLQTGRRSSLTGFLQMKIYS